ncbi:MAG: ATP-binding cassette domain-containing protein [Lachnospiraceae bacterium]|nr:ATP-binding cassette domain-containing protein [Lachnospiraceae bacterium]
MSKEVLCRCSQVTVKGQQNVLLNDISLQIKKEQITALISEDDSAGEILKLIAGLYQPDKGQITYPGMKKEEVAAYPKRIQYVPDDIICYPDLTVWDFIHGIANGSEQMEATAEKLLSLFGINANEQLLEMTFGDNRLVSIIQAVMAQPALLLLDRPYDMLEREDYRRILKEIVNLYSRGSGIVIAAQSYKEVVIPCHEYIFLENGKIAGQYNRDQLPLPAKVVTLWGGSIASFMREKMEILSRNKECFRFLYRESDMKELGIRIGMSGCRNFNVEELTMEEELFENYERWLQ